MRTTAATGDPGNGCHRRTAARFHEDPPRARTARDVTGLEGAFRTALPSAPTGEAPLRIAFRAPPRLMSPTKTRPRAIRAGTCTRRAQ
jgi:hypothetical protein